MKTAGGIIKSKNIKYQKQAMIVADNGTKTRPVLKSGTNRKDYGFEREEQVIVCDFNKMKKVAENELAENNIENDEDKFEEQVNIENNKTLMQNLLAKRYTATVIEKGTKKTDRKKFNLIV